ncbi:MAG: hypothetical protein RIS52_190 [Pseudomonadota bacterium]
MNYETFDLTLGKIMQNHTIAFALIIFGAILCGTWLERYAAQSSKKRGNGARFQHWNRKKWVGQAKVAIPSNQPFSTGFDATEQLRQVMAAPFTRRAILNKSEARLFAAVEKTLVDLGSEWRLMAQVSLGEILSSSDKSAYTAINSKRVDILIVDASGMPLHAIEYQGGGHYQGTAAVRDAVKKEALRRAGVGYVEIAQGDTHAEMRATLLRLVTQSKEYKPPKKDV